MPFFACPCYFPFFYLILQLLAYTEKYNIYKEFWDYTWKCRAVNSPMSFVFLFTHLICFCTEAVMRRFFSSFGRLKMGILCRYRVKRKQIQRFTNEAIRYVRPTDKAHQPTIFFSSFATKHFILSSLQYLFFRIPVSIFFSLFHCLICSCTVFFSSLFSITCRKPN